MTYFMRNGTRYDVTNDANLEIVRVLPIGTYTVQWDNFRQCFFLDRINDFTHNSKIYGDVLTRVDRVLNTFNDRPASTGLLLSGEKGSGKTLLAKLLSIHAMKQDIPTIVINQAHAGEQFNQFIQNMVQPMVILFDEFEKVYDRDKQDEILTLLDGTYASKKLFIVTCNERYRINDYMLNRPGRFFYALDYQGIEESFIREYAEDNLKDPSSIEDIVRTSRLFESYNFDMLKALVEELNRYGETVIQAMHYLNMNPDTSLFQYIVTKFEYKGKNKFKDFYQDISYGERINILEGFNVRYSYEEAYDNDDPSSATPTLSYAQESSIRFEFSDVIRYDTTGNIIVAETEEAYVEIKRKTITRANYLALL